MDKAYETHCDKTTITFSRFIMWLNWVTDRVTDRAVEAGRMVLGLVAAGDDGPALSYVVAAAGALVQGNLDK